MKIPYESRDGIQSYDSKSGEMIHVDSFDSESMPYAIHPLATELAGTAFDSVLLMPEEPATDNLALFFYGIGADYQQYRGLATEMVKRHGQPVALHATPTMEKIVLPKIGNILRGDFLRKKNRDELVHSAQYLFETLRNPYVHDSMAAEAVADAALDHSPELTGIVPYGHSKGGLPEIIFTSYDPRVKAMYADAISGAVDRIPIVNHAESAFPIFKDAKSIMKEIPADDHEDVIAQFRQKKLLIALQLLYLVGGRRPDITSGLVGLHENDRDVPVVYVSRADDTIFKDKDTQLAGQLWLQNGLISLHERVENSPHHAAIEDPKGSAGLFKRLIHKVTSDRAGKVAS